MNNQLKLTVAQNGNTKWQEAEATEIRQLHEYSTFVDKGIGCKTPDAYKRIRFHMVYDIKHDGVIKVD